MCFTKQSDSPVIIDAMPGEAIYILERLLYEMPFGRNMLLHDSGLKGSGRIGRMCVIVRGLHINERRITDSPMLHVWHAISV